MSQEKSRRPVHRAVYDPGTNSFDFEEAIPPMDRPGALDELCDRIYDFVFRRCVDGDPPRWRCLIIEFGAPFGANAHYRISYAVNKLKTARKVKIREGIPERIVRYEEPDQFQQENDFKFGRIKA